MARFAMLLMLAASLVGCNARKRVDSKQSYRSSAMNSDVRSALAAAKPLSTGNDPPGQRHFGPESAAILHEERAQSGVNLERQLDLLENEIGKRH